MNFKKIIPGFFFTLAFFSCDTDAIELGDQSAFFGSENFDSFIEVFNISPKDNPDIISGLQSDNLAIAPLGSFDNVGIQKYNAHYVTQVVLPEKPTFPLATDGSVNPVVVEKVVLYVPYFIRSTTGTAPNQTIVLDSIYKNDTDKLNLKIFKNNFLLRDFNPGSSSSQAYFTNQYNDFNNALGSNPQLNLGITDAPTSENTEFVFSNQNIINKVPKVDGTFEDQSLPPGLFAQLQKADFQQIIEEYRIEQRFPSTSRVFNQNIFNNFFRGLFFKVDEAIGAKQALGLLNFNQGYLRVYYRDQPTGATAIKTLDFRLGGKSASLVEKVNSIGTDNQQIVINPYLDKIYTFQLNLFNRLSSDAGLSELMALRARFKNEKWLLNSVDMTFHVVESPTRKNPPRLYLYDFTNKRVLADFVDFSADGTPGKLRYSNFGGIYSKTAKAYTFRLTNHIRSILAPASSSQVETEVLTKAFELANIEIGLVAVENISDFSLVSAKTGTTVVDRFIPKSVVYQPFTTILNNVGTADASKKPTLKINYIKPRN
jgi:hypothetical protein